LGATDDQLEKTYEIMCEKLVPYEPSPEEITISNWRKHLGNRQFCKSYRDFFNEQLITNGNNWQKKMIDFLLDNSEQSMINCITGGLGHPLIHIGYAFELDSQIVGVDALAMTAVCYNDFHEVIDKLKPPKSPSKTALEIFKNIHSDTQLPIYDAPNFQNIESIVKNSIDRVFFHYNQWKINTENLEKTIEELFDLTVYIYGATHKPNDIEFEFFLLHLLTSMHAIRIIYPHINDSKIFEHILLQFFCFAIVLYISQLRPEINEDLIHDYQIDEEKNNWDYVIDRTLNTKLIDDEHVAKVIRALRDAEKVYGNNNKNGLYLKTAVKTVDNLDFEDPWIIKPDDKRQLNVLKHS
jgi:hypothetical protein